MPKVRVTITIDKSLLEKVDAARGSVSRSEYIERVLAERLASPVPRAAAPGGRAGEGAALEVLREILRELRVIRRLLGEGEIVVGRREERLTAPRAEEAPALPSFAADNPWLEVLSRRGD